MRAAPRPIVLALGVLLCLALAACGRPLPWDKSAYAGEWTAPNMRLWIGTDGRVEYARRNGSVSTSINAPIERFEGNNFVVGAWFMSTTFVVSRAPYQNGGRWKMIVDGVELTRTEQATRSTPI